MKISFVAEGRVDSRQGAQVRQFSNPGEDRLVQEPVGIVRLCGCICSEWSTCLSTNSTRQTGHLRHSSRPH